MVIGVQRQRCTEVASLHEALDGLQRQHRSAPRVGRRQKPRLRMVTVFEHYTEWGSIRGDSVPIRSRP